MCTYNPTYGCGCSLHMSQAVDSCSLEPRSWGIDIFRRRPRSDGKVGRADFMAWIEADSDWAKIEKMEPEAVTRRVAVQCFFPTFVMVLSNAMLLPLLLMRQ